MGISCVKSHGEAEALCARLNEDGLVDGCISQDSDCFLYGAKTVYKNFSISAQGNSGATGGSVEIYSIEKIEKILNIGRNKMIALALLCGCDYNEGVNGVGKEAALKFFKTVEEKDVLQRLNNWRFDKSLDRTELELLNPDLCTSCGHQGKLRKHLNSGCVDCGTIRTCNDDFKEKRALILNEISLRKKALHDKNFPSQELIDEFLTRKDSALTKLDIKWKQPQIFQFIDFMDKHVCWKPQYAFEKIFALTTRWQVLHLPDFTIHERLSMTDLFIPDYIKKIRNIRSIASYEIIWKKEHTAVDMLNEFKKQAKEDDDDDDDDINDNLLSSIEPQEMVLKCYPELVETFENTRNVKMKKKVPTTRRKKVTANAVNTNNDVEINDIKLNKKKLKTKTKENNRKIDEFIHTNALSLEDSFEQMIISPKRSKKENVSSKVNKLKHGPQFKRVLETEKLNSKLNNTFDKMFNELSSNDFMSENEDNELDVTHVIENICSKQVFQISMKNHQSIKSSTSTIENIKECTKTDELESVTCTKENYIYKDHGKQTSDNSDDEFGDINESYIPINQRIQLEKGQEFLSSCNQVEKKFNCDFENIMDETNNKSICLDM
ncbi:hypothetical protein PUN28_001626 [Cardiocondyla obscurior]